MDEATSTVSAFFRPLSPKLQRFGAWCHATCDPKNPFRISLSTQTKPSFTVKADHSRRLGATMFRVVECIVYQHDSRLVFLAALVWVLGAVALFLLLKRSTDCVESRRRQWIAIAALAAGVGVWATHFIAMLAYRGAVPLRFDPGRTALSVLFAILFFWLAFLVAGRSFRALQSLAAGLLAASGVAAMHFAGMAAIVGPVAVRYDWNTVIIAFATVALAFASSFFLFGRLDDWRRIALPASLAVFGVVALHFTAVSATTLVPDPVRGFAASPGDSGWLLIGIVAATMALIGLVLAGAILDRLFTDMRGLTEATLKGLAIVGRGGIVEANSQLAALLGVDRLDLLGSDPACWFKTVDGAALDVERPEACEALVQRRCGAELIVEIAVHAIEYRGRRCRVLAIRDLTARKEAERHIKHLAVHVSKNEE